MGAQQGYEIMMVRSFFDFSLMLLYALCRYFFYSGLSRAGGLRLSFLCNYFLRYIWCGVSVFLGVSFSLDLMSLSTIHTQNNAFFCLWVIYLFGLGSQFFMICWIDTRAVSKQEVIRERILNQ